MATPSSPRGAKIFLMVKSRVKQKLLYICVLGTLLSFASVGEANAQDSQPEVIEVDTQAPSHPFPHFWEQMFGSGRAILSLRESYRNDLREVKSITDFQYVRFHAIFHDEVGLYDEDAAGNPVYNFSYVDQIYDGLLQNHVRPFVELSFMPKKLASADAAPFLLVQAKCVAAERLRSLGCDDFSFRKTL